MSAEVLRAAARLMRERAEVGRESEYPSPWSASLDEHDPETYEVLCHADGCGLVADDLDPEVAEHIASWHPAVALAVADWLEAVADGLEKRGVTARIRPDELAALTVARTYLGAT